MFEAARILAEPAAGEASHALARACGKAAEKAGGFILLAQMPEPQPAWGQYFGPPNTDGAPFDRYRNMLIRTFDDVSLLLGQATSRAWMEQGKRIRVERAPTEFGPLTMTIESRAGEGAIAAVVDLSGRNPPAVLRVRLRHPQARAMKSVTVNGRAWEDFDADREWVRIAAPVPARCDILARYRGRAGNDPFTRAHFEHTAG